MDLRKDEDRAALADEFGPIETEPSEYTVDRTGWPQGPWDGEPDYVSWVDAETGLACTMVRDETLGHWKGTVGIEKGHRWWKVAVDEIAVSVHGGLMEAALEDGRWWLGFNCGHSYDFNPATARYLKLFQRAARSYKTVEFVKAECAKLAGQLK